MRKLKSMHSVWLAFILVTSSSKAVGESFERSTSQGLYEKGVVVVVQVNPLVRSRRGNQGKSRKIATGKIVNAAITVLARN